MYIQLGAVASSWQSQIKLCACMNFRSRMAIVLKWIVCIAMLPGFLKSYFSLFARVRAYIFLFIYYSASEKNNVQMSWFLHITLYVVNKKFIYWIFCFGILVFFNLFFFISCVLFLWCVTFEEATT